MALGSRRFRSEENTLLLSMIVFVTSPIKCNADEGDTYICEEYQEYVYQISKQYSLCPELIMAIIETESSGKADAVSEVGCMGLMQIYPKFHEDRMERLGVTDLADAYSNILVGCDYLAEMAGKYHDIMVVLVGYNAGEYSEAMEKAKQGEWNTYAEKVLKRSEELERIHEKMTEKRICANEKCGAEFIATRKDNIYCCLQCGTYVNRKRYEERQKAERRKDREIRERMRPTRKRKPKMCLAEVNERARQEGLSYGQYIVKYGL